jgi:hypothetical protein
MDDRSFAVTGKYLGVNSHRGIGPYNVRVFIESINGTIVDGIVSKTIWQTYVKGKTYTPYLIYANDPYPDKRTWV